MIMRPSSILFLLPCVFLLLASSCEKKNGPARILGTEPISISAETAEEGGALIEWARNGYRGMTVIHADAHAGLDPLPDKNVTELQKLVKSKDWDALKGAVGETGTSLVTGSNYLSAAVCLGIVKKIFWIIPYPFFEQAGGGERARQFLIDRGLVKDRNEAAGFGMAGGCLHGQARNIEITVCAPDTMHLIRKPVLLDMNTNYFLAFARSRGITLLEGFKLFMDAMFVRNYRIAAAGITTSFSDGYYDPALAYIGSQVREVLKDPSIMRQEAPPPLWSARDEGVDLLQKREFRRAYDMLQASIRKFGPDKGLRALFSIAAVQQGRYEEALPVATGLCRADRRHCPLLAHLSGIADVKGRPDMAAVFLERGRDAWPQSIPAAKKILN